MVRAPAIIGGALALAMTMTTPALAADGEVQIAADAASVASCERLGEVQSSSLLTGLLAAKGRQRAVAQLKERSSKLGATHVVVVNANFGYASNNMLGVAYKCPPPPPKP